jgi:WD40 repeat protein
VLRAELLLEQCPKQQRRWEWRYLDNQCHAALLTLTGHTGGVHGVAWSPDGKRLASASFDGVRVWDAANGRALGSWGSEKVPWGVTFSPDGKQLAVYADSGNVQILEPTSGRKILTIRISERGRQCAAYSADSTRLVSRGPGLTAKVWDARSGRELLTLAGHRAPVVAVAFSPDFKLLATGAKDGVAKLWDAATGKEVRSLTRHREELRSLAFSPDGTRLATASDDETTRVWEVATGREVLSLRGHTDRVARVVFSPDGERLATGSFDHTIKVWNAGTGIELFTLRGHSAGVADLAFSPDGLRLASAGADHTIKVWDAINSPERHSFRPDTTTNPHATPPVEKIVWAVAFSPDGTRLVCGYKDTLRVCEARTGRALFVLRGHTNRVWSVAWSADGRTIASASDDGTVRLWDAGTAKLIRTYRTSHGMSVAFSPDGKRLAAPLSKRAAIWDVASGQQRLIGGPSEEFFAVTFSPDGHRLASVIPVLDEARRAFTGAVIKVWDVTSRAGNITVPLLTLRGHSHGVGRIAFSPDGKTLASAGGDRLVLLWDVSPDRRGEVKTPLRVLKGHSDVLRGLAFSPDGSRLASGGSGGEVKLWDPPTGQEVLTLRWLASSTSVNPGGLKDVVFCRDGGRLACATGLGEVCIWEAEERGPGWEEVRRQRLAALARQWQASEVQRCVRDHLPFPAAWHLDRLIGPKTTDPVLFWQRGTARAGLERWEAAAGDLARAIELAGNRAPPVWLMERALVCCWRDDVPGYRAACKRLVEAPTVKPGIASLACSLAGDSGVAPARVVALAEEAPRARQPAQVYLISRMVLGVALYRAGRYEEALRQVKEDRPENPLTLGGCFCRAMAQHHLGQTREAQQTLREATAALERILHRGFDQPRIEWRGQLQLMLLRREAEATLAKPPVMPKK